MDPDSNPSFSNSKLGGYSEHPPLPLTTDSQNLYGMTVRPTCHTALTGGRTFANPTPVPTSPDFLLRNWLFFFSQSKGLQCRLTLRLWLRGRTLDLGLANSNNSSLSTVHQFTDGCITQFRPIGQRGPNSSYFILLSRERLGGHQVKTDGSHICPPPEENLT